MLTPAQRTDLDHILTGATGAATPMDELTLLRIALRAYSEGMPALEALAWAAAQLSNSLTHAI